MHWPHVGQEVRYYCRMGLPLELLGFQIWDDLSTKHFVKLEIYR